MPEVGTSSIQHPAIRHNLIAALFRLASEDYQKLVWIKNRFDPISSGYSGFQFVVEVLDSYDYRQAKAIGEVFYSRDEQAAIQALLDSVDDLFEHYGDMFIAEMSDADYISTPEWKTVMRSAQAAYELLADEDRRHASGPSEEELRANQYDTE